MSASRQIFRSQKPLRHRVLAAIRRGLSKFLALPLIVIAGFVLLNVLSYQADRSWSQGDGPDGFLWLGRLVGDQQALAGLLTTVASSIITVTSITFALLPVAVQQGSSAMTSQVTDQFMMRRTNQLYFGYFVGLCIFVLMTVVTHSSFHRPVFSAAIALVLTGGALCLIVVMIYNTIDQMRPGPIIAAIHGHILKARDEELALLNRTRRTSRSRNLANRTLHIDECGYLTALDVERIEQLLSDTSPDAEIEVLVPVGTYLASGDPLFRLSMDRSDHDDDQAFEALAARLFEAVSLDDARDLSSDPRFGLFQLSMIGWTSVSTAKSNPGPGLRTIDALRDILSRWSGARDEHEGPGAAEVAASRIVYQDRTVHEAVDVLETLIVVSSESMQVQTLASAFDTIALLLPRVDRSLARELEDAVLRALSSLGEHVMTRSLADSLDRLSAALAGRRLHRGRAALDEAAATLRASIGRLNSRSTRVPSPA